MKSCIKTCKTLAYKKSKDDLPIPVRIAMVQFTGYKSYISKVLDEHIGNIEKAVKENRGIVYFPEMSLGMQIISDGDMKNIRHKMCELIKKT